jgi:hypothetical protein
MRWWVFGDRHTGGYLHRFAWTNIVRHQIVKHAASLDDPELADYWAWPRRKAPLPINRTALRLHWKQDGRCGICKTTLLAASDRPQTPREWEHWLATTRKTIDVVWTTATSDTAETRLIHLHCQPTHRPQGLARAGCSQTGTSGFLRGPGVARRRAYLTKRSRSGRRAGGSSDRPGAASQTTRGRPPSYSTRHRATRFTVGVAPLVLAHDR